MISFESELNELYVTRARRIVKLDVSRGSLTRIELLLIESYLCICPSLAEAAESTDSHRRRYHLLWNFFRCLRLCNVDYLRGI